MFQLGALPDIPRPRPFDPCDADQLWWPIGPCEPSDIDWQIRRLVDHLNAARVLHEGDALERYHWFDEMVSRLARIAARLNEGKLTIRPRRYRQKWGVR